MDDIRNINKSGYNRLAPDFTEDKRVTTSNFHQLSSDFFNYLLQFKVKKETKVLELGVGRGWLRSNFEWPNVEYVAVDIAEKMADGLENIIICPVEEMPFDDSQFDYVIASLGDPFFYKDALKEISRVTKDGGVFAFSAPSHEWARALRGNRMFSSFVVNGENIETYSFTYNKEEMIKLWSDCNFEPVTIQDWYCAGITDRISNDISSIYSDGEQPSIVTTAVFVNKKNK